MNVTNGMPDREDIRTRVPFVCDNKTKYHTHFIISTPDAAPLKAAMASGRQQQRLNFARLGEPSVAILDLQGPSQNRLYLSVGLRYTSGTKCDELYFGV